jgi:predicted transcriptional regulator
MKSNPITALSDLFGKLVVEHGSAVVQEKHIALLKEQFAILERENTKLNTRLEKSESEKQILKTENKNFKKENIQLKKKIESIQSNLRDKGQILILQCLATLEPDKMMPESSIVSTCNLSKRIVNYHLRELEEEDMVECEDSDGSDELYWYLAHDGLGYLIKHKLISQQTKPLDGE